MASQEDWPRNHECDGRDMGGFFSLLLRYLLHLGLGGWVAVVWPVEVAKPSKRAE